MRSLVAALITIPSLAFVPQIKRKMLLNMRPKLAMKSDGFDLDKARRSLENLLDETEDATNAVDGSPLMTTTGLNRLRKEIKLLSELESSDAALKELTALWYEEHGKLSSAKLREADKLVNQQQYQLAERILKELCAQYGSSWAEPHSRVAHLYFVQGRMEECTAECQRALSIKPWHFVALNEMTMANAFLHDLASMRQWAALQLPAMTGDGIASEKRKQWVFEATNCAKRVLMNEETRLQMSFNAVDDEWQ
mmetsp:Transcript_5433/g.7860  ORF Transcript_5433/g.7860 Transcript_5433/m.7860 type:complete len:252 (+) Transcript_5433:127-882(+)|eukprot:CAMPEP_0202474076 /NCGR_PEP_ID=MMETSP1360-20130828/92188_1 /ASSEMBLY_ACC=CAM_ASM_000848 /TAXON_ID=515479 /ORGANISM="Licmophora paradoxa, Strain CCMP2313" /LENGTH=251 /DNA_ID=CAMNT_0049101175 /DNA_START=51 /DNA_END=806 /DNA_ORIENTATION=-